VKAVTDKPVAGSHLPSQGSPHLLAKLLQHRGVYWFALISPLLLTACAWYFAHGSVHQKAHARFKTLAEETQSAIASRMGDYEQLLRAGGGLFASSQEVSRDEWRTFAAALKIGEKFPGIQGIGFSQWIPAEQKEAHLKQIQAEGFKTYYIKPSGERPFYSSVIYLEPFDDRNQRAFGFDMYAEPVRRAAMEAARDSGEPTLSGRVTLVQETARDAQPGCLLYLPVYRRGQAHDTVAERQAALVGWVYAPFRFHDLMNGILGASSKELGVEIYDGKTAAAQGLVYATQKKNTPVPAGYQSQFSEMRQIEISGHTWTLQLFTLPPFDAATTSIQPLAVAGAGLLISLLVMGVVWTVSKSGHQAISLVENLSQESKENKEELQTVMDTAHEAIIIADEAGAITYFNRAGENIFGYTGREVLGSPLAGLMTESSGKILAEKLQSLRECKATEDAGQTIDLTGRRKNGKEFPLEISVAARRTPKGLLFTGFLRDITERHEAEAELRASEERFRTLVEKASDGIFICNQAGVLLNINFTAAKMLGLTREDIVGHNITDFLVDGGTESVKRRINQLLTGTTGLNEWLFVRKNGSKFPVEINVSVLPDNRVQGIVRDITERKLAEEVARQSEERFRSYFQLGQVGMVITSPEKGWIEANDAVCKILGYSRKELQELTWAELTYPPDLESDLVLFRQVVAGEIEGYNLEKRFVRKDGGIISSNLSVRCVRKPDGKVDYFVGMIQDITAARQAELELRQAKESAEMANTSLAELNEQLELAIERAQGMAQAAETANHTKSAFLAAMSHEIRTPMNGIIGFTSLLLDTPLDKSQRESVEIIQGCSETLLTLINDILDFSKIEADKLTLEQQPFDLAACLDECIKIVTPKASEKHLDLRMLSPTRLDNFIIGDMVRVRQVILNLLSNAVKFTHRGGIIVDSRVLQFLDGEVELEVSVRDTGIGIPKDKLHRLFQPFSQVDASTTRKYGGTGLGLVISKRLAEAMQGGISVDSAEGVGATFRFRFRAGYEQAKAKNNQQREEKSADGNQPAPASQGISILLTEDNLLNQRLIIAQLKQMGHRADIVSNGEAALEIIQSRHYDVILMDIQMPKMDGYETTRNIRKLTHLARQPFIIAVTAHALKGDDHLCYEAGMDCYLTKPVRLEELRAALEQGAEAMANNHRMTPAIAT